MLKLSDGQDITPDRHLHPHASSPRRVDHPQLRALLSGCAGDPVVVLFAPFIGVVTRRAFSEYTIMSIILSSTCYVSTGGHRSRAVLLLRELVRI